MANLFSDKPDLTRQQKTKASRKATSDLTLWAINFLNDSMQFRVHRSNNTHPPIIKREKKRFTYLDENHIQQFFEFEEVTMFYKKNSIKQKILDISGIVLPYNGNEKLAGKHF